MSDRLPSSLLSRLPLILGNACAVGLGIGLIAVLLIRQAHGAPSSAVFVFGVTMLVLGPLGVVTMLVGWRGLLRDGNAKYCWFALAIGAFSSAIGLNFGLFRMF